MKRAVAIAFVVGALGMLGAPCARAQAPDCVVPRSAPRATLRRPDGVELRLEAHALVVGDRRFDRCSGLPGAHPSALTADGDTVYLGFRDVGVHRLRDGAFERIDGIPPGPVRALTMWRGELLVGLGTAGLHRVGEAGVTAFRHLVLGRRGITALEVDDAGALHVGVDPYGHWIVGSEDGARPRRVARQPVACFLRRGARVRAGGYGDCAAPRRLAAAHGTALMAFGGRMYAGTFDDGLYRLAPGSAGPTRVPGSPPYVNALATSGETLYIAAATGLYAMDRRERFRTIASVEGLSVHGMAARGETLWLATGRGLVEVRGGRIRVLDESAGLPGRIVYSVATTDDGAVWAGTARGALRIGPDGARRLYSLAGGELAHDWVTAIASAGDTVYIGTYDGGVVRVAPGGAARQVAGTERLWVNPGGIARVGSALYVSTLGDGLVRVRAGRAQPIAPLPSDDVTAVASGPTGLWVATRAGYARLATARP